MKRWNQKELDIREISGEFECRPIEGWSRYFVRADGTLWSSKSGEWKQIGCQKKTANGYYRINLRDYGRHRLVFVHTLVLEAFVGPCPEGMETRHLNGVRHDNRLENLAYGTPQENTEDKIRHGTWVHGETVPCSVLTDKQAMEIRCLYWRGVQKTRLGKLYGITLGTTTALVEGRTWKHLPLRPDPESLGLGEDLMKLEPSDQDRLHFLNQFRCALTFDYEINMWKVKVGKDFALGKDPRKAIDEAIKWTRKNPA